MARWDDEEKSISAAIFAFAFIAAFVGYLAFNGNKDSEPVIEMPAPEVHKVAHK